MPVCDVFNRLHNVGQLACKAECRGKIAVLRFELGKLFYPKAVKALTADKFIACHNCRGVYTKLFKGGQHLVSAVAHSVEHDGLAAAFERLPNVRQGF